MKPNGSCTLGVGGEEANDGHVYAVARPDKLETDLTAVDGIYIYVDAVLENGRNSAS